MLYSDLYSNGERLIGIGNPELLFGVKGYLLRRRKGVMLRLKAHRPDVPKPERERGVLNFSSM